jgi:penicillin-binding protein 1B
VKNFLTPERTLQRKFTELLMAVLLELHYGKDEILETYLNEIYLGQDRDRAIHGVGLAAQHYFGKEVQHLNAAESALLVGMVRGPVHYDPYRHPQRALERRNFVLREARDQKAITPDEYAAARAGPLNVSKKTGTGTTPYPAFLLLVHRQLRRDYDEADLRTEGLRIFTTLDPRVQVAAETALGKRLAQFDKEKRFGAPGLEGAVVVTDPQSG